MGFKIVRSCLASANICWKKSIARLNEPNAPFCGGTKAPRAQWERGRRARVLRAELGATSCGTGVGS